MRKSARRPTGAFDTQRIYYTIFIVKKSIPFLTINLQMNLLHLPIYFSNIFCYTIHKEEHIETKIKIGGTIMKLTISGRDMTVRSDLREITEKRIAKLDRFFESDAEVNVIYSKKRNLQIAEITVYAQGTFFRSEVESDTFNNSLDEAIEVITRQIRKNKTKLERKLRAGAFQQFEDDFDLDEPAFEVRTKTFPIKPMALEEAILQMNLLGHQFFVFRDAPSSNVCVVYRRKDGAYGLIVPQ